MLNHISYLDNEIADNDANYFLMEINEKDDIDSNTTNIKELSVNIDGYLLIELTTKPIENFPLFCFENGNVDSMEKLNLKKLKKFSFNCLGKYMVVSLQDNSQTDVGYIQDKTFDDWHNKNPNVKITFLLNDNTNKHYCGKMLKIFYKEYQPTISE